MQERMEELIKIVNEADYNYHTLDNPTITDQEYDKYLRELIEIETEHPDWIRDYSPTQHAGGEIIDSFKKITHRIIFNIYCIFCAKSQSLYIIL